MFSIFFVFVLVPSQALHIIYEFFPNSTSFYFFIKHKKQNTKHKTQNTKQNTVGYGDLTPQTTTERTYSSIIMIIGATVFGYIVGNVSQMVGQLDVGAAKQREQREEVRNYMKVRHFFFFFFFLFL